LLFQVMCSVAIYCQRCGQIHIHDVPYFGGQKEIELNCRNCSHRQGTVRLLPKRGVSLDLTCGACHAHNRLTYPLSLLRRLNFEKIYCRQDNFELGYIGKWQSLAEFLDFNAAEYEALNPHDEDDFIYRQQILLEALNRVHDLAADRELFCSCGSHDFVADVADREILLECTRCGGQLLIPAASAEDLRRLTAPYRADFILPDVVGKR